MGVLLFYGRKLYMANRFKKTKKIKFEDTEFDLKRPSALVLMDFFELILKSGAVDIVSAAIAITQAETEEEKNQITSEIFSNVINVVQSGIKDIKEPLIDIVAELTNLDEDEKEDVPLEFVALVLEEAAKTIDAKAFFEMFQRIFKTAETKIQVAQAIKQPATISPIG